MHKDSRRGDQAREEEAVEREREKERESWAGLILGVFKRRRAVSESTYSE